ncbi:lipopolysaccharide biosynthesis protein [Algoriphagus marincola]|uniref:lipopolysaccharide biosynthesis protein n=1 Tax=Algoriphagus marincola TaxID=264027 RepID=UPI00040805A8|nr:oligosaccharide flippase family protein [Algoriphagus marincola]
MFKSLFKGILFKVFDFIRPFIVIPFFIRTYGVDSYGIYVQIILLASLSFPIIDLGIGMGIQRYSHQLKNINDRLEVFKVQKLFIPVFLVAYLAIISNKSIRILLFGKFESLLLILATLTYIIFFSLNNTLQGVLRSDSKIGNLIKYRGLFAVFEAVILIFILQVHQKFDFIYVFTMALAQMLYFFFLNKEANGIGSRFHIDLNFTDKTKEFFGYSLYLIPSALIGWITSSSDRFFITGYFGAEQTGYYSAIAQYAGYMNLIVFPFTFVFFKDYGRLYDENFKKFLRFYLKTFFLCVVFSLSYFIAFYFFSTTIYEYYIGLEIRPEFYTLLFWFLISFLLINISSFLSTYMLVSKNTKLMLFAVLVGALANFILNCFFLKNYTYVHAAYYWAFSVGFQIIVMGSIVVRNILKFEKNIIR